MDGALVGVMFKKKRGMSGLLYVTRIFQGVRKWGRGGRALPRVYRTASLAANMRPRSIRLANLTHKCDLLTMSKKNAADDSDSEVR